MVYLIAQPSIKRDGSAPDLSSLGEHGEVKVLIENGDYPTFKPSEAYEKIASRLKDFDAENDYIVWAGGDTLAAVFVGMVLKDLGHRYFRWLRFERGVKENGDRDNSRGKYTPIEIIAL